MCYVTCYFKSLDMHYPSRGMHKQAERNHDSLAAAAVPSVVPSVTVAAAGWWP